jgi:GH24 family phage-related lysozyme (muramidase)
MLLTKKILIKIIKESILLAEQENKNEILFVDVYTDGSKQGLSANYAKFIHVDSTGKRDIAYAIDDGGKVYSRQVKSSANYIEVKDENEYFNFTVDVFKLADKNKKIKDFLFKRKGRTIPGLIIKAKLEQASKVIEKDLDLKSGKYHFVNTKKGWEKVAGSHPNKSLKVSKTGAEMLTRHEGSRAIPYSDAWSTKQALSSFGKTGKQPNAKEGDQVKRRKGINPLTRWHGGGVTPEKAYGTTAEGRMGFPTIGIGHLIWHPNDPDVKDDRKRFEKYLAHWEYKIVTSTVIDEKTKKKTKKKTKIKFKVYGELMSEKDIEKLAQEDLDRHLKRVIDAIEKFAPNITFNQNQIDALAMFAFNVPKRRVNAFITRVDKKGIKSALNYLLSIDNDGELAKRRKLEYNLFSFGKYD